MTKEQAEQELEKYVGLPMCQDCGWKLGTDITNNCGCRSAMFSTDREKYNKAFLRARELQAIINGGNSPTYYETKPVF